MKLENLVAYDYNHQKWVQGEAARRAWLRQLIDALRVLRSPRAKQFVDENRSLKFLGVDGALNYIEFKLKELVKL